MRRSESASGKRQIAQFLYVFGTKEVLLAACVLRECCRAKRAHLESRECNTPKPLANYGLLRAIAYWAHFLAIKGLSLSS